MLKFYFWLFSFLTLTAWAIIENNFLCLTIIIIFFISILFLGVSFIQLKFFVKAFCKKQTKQKVIAITFDDGPCLQTKNIIEILDKYNAKATFFCIGNKINNYKDLIKQISDKGHCIGNHSYSHSNIFPLKTTKNLIKEIVDTNNIIEQITKEKNNFFRPPFGVTNPNISRAIKSTGMIVGGWSIRSYDTCSKNNKKTINRIKRQISSGKILLLHDNSKHITDILEQILKHLQKHDYKTLTINELYGL